ncbi:hypothetical protein [Kitasatospora azatica]|uniref:hypothetical protein n=1 Tax=Kitasatospora azatica TaxID=58347 RepID=UPI00068F32FE|nr:hypothetical protein [Kitasatospora azatica]
MTSEDLFEAELTELLTGAAGQVRPTEPPLGELRRLGARRQRRRRAVRMAAAAVAVCAAVAVGQFGIPGFEQGPAGGAGTRDPLRCTGAPPPVPAPTGSATAADQGPDVEGAAGAAEQFGEGSAYLNVYSGVCIDHPRHTVYVYRVRGSDFDKVVRGAAGRPGVTLRFVDAKYSHVKLAEAADRIIGDQYWRQKGVLIRSTAALPDGSGVEVAVTDPDALRAELVARYGPVVASVVQGAAYSSYR